MTGSLIGELRSIPILSNKNVFDLRNYISNKHADLSLYERAEILADAVNRVIDRWIPLFEAGLRRILRENIIRTSINNDSMDINSADVFIECAKLKIEEDAHYSELCRWVNRIVPKKVEWEEIISLAAKIYKYFETHPEFHVDNIIHVLTIPAEKETETYVEENDTSVLSALESVYLEHYRGKVDTEAHKLENRFVIPIKILPAIAAAAILVLSLMINLFFPGAQLENKAFSGLILNYNPKNAIQADSGDIRDAGTGYDYLPGFIEPDENENLEASVFTLNREKKMDMRATAYDLSVESCGKLRSHPEYGITFSGAKAIEGRTVAVDPSVIKLGTRLYIVFPEKYRQLDGIYVAEDTGRLVKGDIIDIFLGEDKINEGVINKKVHDFGVQPVQVFPID